MTASRMSFEEQIDEIVWRMLTMPHTGGEIYNHSPEQVRNAKAELLKLHRQEVERIIGEDQDYGPLEADDPEVFWYESRNELRFEQRQRAGIEGE